MKGYITSDSVIMPAQDMPFFGIRPGQVLRLTVEDNTISCGNLTWSVEQLENEIKAGIWWYLAKLPEQSG